MLVSSAAHLLCSGPMLCSGAEGKRVSCSALLSAAVLFMEHWKRRQMRLNYVWDLTGFGEEEEVS